MRRGADFSAAVRAGRRAGRRTLVVHLATPAVTPSEPLVGFVVSRAVGPAVVRNRVKRRLRHLMATRVDQLPAGSLVVIRANPASAGEPSRLESDLDGALARVLGARS
jgi:ribonuclease P protein component